MNLVGQRFGRLVVLKHSHNVPRKPNGVIPHWLCKCDCGAEKSVCQWSLTRGLTNSCGCYNAECASARNKKDIRTSDDAAYGCWSAMKERCYRKNHEAYQRYGGQGVVVCEQWLNSFETFLKDMGPRPSLAHSLDRYPNKSGNYEPGNVRWAVAKEQQRNLKSNKPVEFRGESKLITEWSEVTGLKITTIRERLRRGWSVERTLTTSV